MKEQREWEYFLAPSREVIMKAIDRLIAKETSKKVKQSISKDFIRWRQFFRFMLTNEHIYGLLTFEYWDHITNLRRKYPRMKMHHYYALAYLSKSGFATPTEMKWFWKRTTTNHEVPTKFTMSWLLTNGFVERRIYTRPGSELRKRIYFLTPKGRELYLEWHNPWALKNVYKEIKMMNSTTMKMRYSKRKNYLQTGANLSDEE